MAAFLCVIQVHELTVGDVATQLTQGVCSGLVLKDPVAGACSFNELPEDCSLSISKCKNLLIRQLGAFYHQAGANLLGDLLFKFAPAIPRHELVEYVIHDPAMIQQRGLLQPAQNRAQNI